MTPRKKKPLPNPETPEEVEANESEESEDRVATISGKGIRVSMPIDRRAGIVLVYAVAFAIVFGTVGWVVFQIITALKITGGSVTQSLGFILWSLITYLCVLLSR